MMSSDWRTTRYQLSKNLYKHSNVNSVQSPLRSGEQWTRVAECRLAATTLTRAISRVLRAGRANWAQCGQDCVAGALAKATAAPLITKSRAITELPQGREGAHRPNWAPGHRSTFKLNHGFINAIQHSRFYDIPSLFAGTKTHVWLQHILWELCCKKLFLTSSSLIYFFQSVSKYCGDWQIKPNRQRCQTLSDKV